MLLQRVKKFILQNQLFSDSADNLHLVGVSGGADSVALLLIMRQLGYRVEAAHCNFKLRGSESDRDEKFVRQLCEEHNIELHIIHFDTATYADKHQVSIEMAARDLRYGYFRQLCQNIGAADVCIAHHRDDAVETLLINLLRGAGIHGLTGIRAKNDYIRRPLLAVSRQEIVDYLDSIGQLYVTDSTNLQPDVLRNKVRLQVLPLLEDIYPGATANIAKSASNLGEAEKMYNIELKREGLGAVNDCNPQRVTISINKLLELPAPITCLHEWLSPYGFNSSQTEDIFSCIHKSGTVFQNAKYQVAIDREEIIVFPVEPAGKPIKIPETGTYRYSGNKSLRVALDKHPRVSLDVDCATLDNNMIKFPLTVRPISDGDWFVPYGMKGRKLVSDFMTDIKASVYDKQHQLVVTDASGSIIWLVGRRVDNRYCIKDSTTEMMVLTLITDKNN